jgi:protein-L-isoaspartate(D-aspartate) O-methyltransferase
MDPLQALLHEIAEEARATADTTGRPALDPRVLRAIEAVPRHLFVPPTDERLAYANSALPIGQGQTISQPFIVALMTDLLEPRPEHVVLEIGTGSGYQSAYLSNLTDKVWTIEIIKPLAERTRGVYDRLIEAGYSEYKAITSKNADGYFGWEEAAPFDKIIVTCGIDHIPPPLLQQLKPAGVMVIPVGPPGAQRILRVVKEQAGEQVAVKRSDIYNGRPVPFVPFTKLEGDAIKGTHFQR